MKTTTKYLLLLTIAAILLLATACIKPTPPTPPPATPVPTVTPTPKPIQYLIIKPDQRAPVYTDTENYIALSQTLHDGDTVPIRNSRNWDGFMWYECLVGDLMQFDPGTTGWVKFRDEKMYLEWRYP